MKVISSFAIVSILALAFGSARADLSPPKPIIGKPAPFVIQVDDKAKEARLVVPENLIPALRADAGTDGADERAGFGLPPTRTVIAGAALALALSFGGLWLVRSRVRQGSRLLTGAVVSLFALGAGAALVWANAAPIPRPAADNLPLAFKGKVVVEKHFRGDTIRLIVSPDMLKKMAEQPQPGAQPKPEE